MSDVNNTNWTVTTLKDGREAVEFSGREEHAEGVFQYLIGKVVRGELRKSVYFHDAKGIAVDFKIWNPKRRRSAAG